MRTTLLIIAAVSTFAFVHAACSAEPWQLDVSSENTLNIPKATHGDPAPGERVTVTAPEYEGTSVFHTVFLPDQWTHRGPKFPIIFEYTGNYFPRSGSTGEPEDAGLGYCLSGGQFIWVSLPYVSDDHQDNQVTWWGDVNATVEYAKRNVPRIIEQFHADPDCVVLCGFSRGAIGVNFLGLHDDEVANLWTAFVSHDHFDGVKEWKRTAWGSPLDRYRSKAAERLRRVRGRPYLVCQNGARYGTDVFVREVLTSSENFTFLNIDAREIFGEFPNPLAKTAHTDVWAAKPSRYREAAWRWMNGVAPGSEE